MTDSKPIGKSLEDYIVQQTGKTTLNTFAHFIIELTECMGGFKSQDSQKVITQLCGYMVDNVITEDGMKYLAQQIKTSQSLGNVYHSFVKGAGETIIDFYSK